MIAEFMGIEWLYWWTIPLFLVGILGNAALLWVGAHFISKLERIDYWLCVRTSIVLVLIALVAYVIASVPFFAKPFWSLLTALIAYLFLGWWRVVSTLKTSLGKAILAWLPSIFVVPFVVTAFLLSSPTRPHKLSDKTTCLSHLNEISKAIAIYGNNNNDAYPPSFKEIIDEKRCPPKIFECPSDKSDRKVDYFYLQPLSNAPATTIILCDYKNNHRDKGRNVAYFDYHGAWLTEEQFQAELAKPQNAAFAKALAEAEGKNNKHKTENIE